MNGGLASRFSALPTAAKLLLFISAALLPLGLGLVWIAANGIRDANRAIEARAEAQSVAATRAIESLIARNALALRVAANGAMRDNPNDPCSRVAATLAIVPAVAQRFSLNSADGALLCEAGNLGEVGNAPLVAPGDVRLWIAPGGTAVDFRLGIIGGMATGTLPATELREVARAEASDIDLLVLTDGRNDMMVIERPKANQDLERMHVSQSALGSGRLTTRVEIGIPNITVAERLLILLPVLMWAVAALISWFLVDRLLIRPLRRLQGAIGDFQPGDDPLVLPRKLGPATEIQDLGKAFVRAVERIDESERQMGDALEGQRKLVREVHHRVKNNLQVIASLLNIHGRSVVTPDAKAAYAAIGRRVDALAVVHRNHFAEMEDGRGIALRPLLTELTAGLRASTPESARAMSIFLELDTLSTTQDIAVAVAFLVTEIVEYAMLRKPGDGVEIALRRSSDLTARLSLVSPVLVPDDGKDPAQVQFERILAGLARQLRSPLDRKLGRYTVDLPVFPEN